MSDKQIHDFDSPLTCATAGSIINGTCQVDPSPAAWARCAAAHDRLRRCIAESRHVYGITTGFGPLANRLIDPAEAVTLQQNLVHHLATGLGAPLDWASARAVCLARLSSIMQGYSGASRPSIEALVNLLNSDVAPIIPERGTVGASGDLTPLAHMVLALQGRGGFMDRAGRRFDGTDGCHRIGLAPLDLHSRDGLALVNGTSAMTGIAVQNAVDAGRLIDWAVACNVALLEVLGGRAEAWSPVFVAIRPHRGQQEITRRLNSALGQSERAIHDPLCARRLDTFIAEELPGQDPYTLRCVPQVLGGVCDVLAWHDHTVLIELNAVSDNPIFPPEGDLAAVHGGNFMGQQIALVSDALANALTVLAGLAERQLARLTDETLNRGLPAFLHRGAAGLNSGFMGAQVTATATLAEMRSHGPASIQSISTNGANQDVVSMGTIAARIARQQVNHCAEIMAIFALGLAQAIELRCEMDCRPFSMSSKDLLTKVRSLSPALTEDRPLSHDIVHLAETMRNGELTAPR